MLYLKGVLSAGIQVDQQDVPFHSLSCLIIVSAENGIECFHSVHLTSLRPPPYSSSDEIKSPQGFKQPETQQCWLTTGVQLPEQMPFYWWCYWLVCHAHRLFLLNQVKEHLCLEVVWQPLPAWGFHSCRSLMAKEQMTCSKHAATTVPYPQGPKVNSLWCLMFFSSAFFPLYFLSPPCWQPCWEHFLLAQHALGVMGFLQFKMDGGRILFQAPQERIYEMVVVISPFSLTRPYYWCPVRCPDWVT